MQTTDVTAQLDTAKDKLLEALGVDPNEPSVDRYVSLCAETVDIPVTDTDGKVIGVIDLTRDWIRL